MTDQEKDSHPGYSKQVEHSPEMTESEIANDCATYWQLISSGFTGSAQSTEGVISATMTRTTRGFDWVDYEWNPTDPTEPDPDEDEQWRDTSPGIVSTSGSGANSSDFRVMGEGTAVKVLIVERERTPPPPPSPDYSEPCPWHPNGDCPNRPTPPSPPAPSPGQTSPYDWVVVSSAIANKGISDIFTVNVAGAAGKDRQKVVIPIRLNSVSLAGGNLYNVSNDAGTITYAAPHWADLNGNAQADATPTDKISPVAFKANITPKIQATYTLGAKAPEGVNLSIQAESSKGFGIPQTNAPNGQGEQTLPETAVTGSFPTIDYFNAPDNEMVWKVSAGGDFKEFGRSKMTVYVVGGEPKTNARFETVYYVGCKGGKGTSGGSAAVNKIYSTMFMKPTLGVTKTKPRYASNGSEDPLKYEHAQGNYTTQTLLVNGEGRCGAWARFFRDCCRLQGAAAEKIDVKPPPVDPVALGFCASFRYPTAEFVNPVEGPGNLLLLVKKWNTANNNGFLTDADELPGIEGQKNENPESRFADHALVMSGGLFYDPSYGSPTFDDPYKWEDFALVGYGGKVKVVDPLGGNSQEQLWVQTWRSAHGEFSLAE